MKLFKLLIVLLIIGCSSNNQSVSNTSSLDYDVLDSFIKDSLPSTLNLDINHSDIFDQWKDINLINTVKKIPLIESKQLNFPINLLKTDILKINDKNVPHALNHPQIIGRFRVLKTDILKINIDDLSFENSKTFKKNLKDIINSYNAFVNTMNLEVSQKDDKILLNFLVVYFFIN
jgi:hypothetical protein